MWHEADLMIISQYSYTQTLSRFFENLIETEWREFTELWPDSIWEIMGPKRAEQILGETKRMSSSRLNSAQKKEIRSHKIIEVWYSIKIRVVRLILMKFLLRVRQTKIQNKKKFYHSEVTINSNDRWKNRGEEF